MISYKDVLALSLQGLNISQLKDKLEYDRNTIRSVIEKATMKGLFPKGWEGLSDEQFKKVLKKITKPKATYPVFVTPEQLKSPKIPQLQPPGDQRGRNLLLFKRPVFLICV